MKKFFPTFLCVFLLAAVPAAPADTSYPPPPENITWKKSAIWLVTTTSSISSGDTLEATFAYYLDPTETWGDKPTTMMCMPLGPWIDNPDGEVNPKRRHVHYPGLGAQHQNITPGNGTITFRWQLREAFRYNSLFFLCKFKRPDGGDWPWDWRGGSTTILRPNQTFIIQPTADGGIFFDDELPTLFLTWGRPPPADTQTATFTVHNIEGEAVLKKQIKVDPSATRQQIRLLQFSEKGTFNVTAEIDGFGSDNCFIAKAPRFRHQKTRPTPFGCTDVSTAAISQLASNLGFSYVRQFVKWAAIEPRPGFYQLDSLTRTIAANHVAGLKPWISLQGAPSWALPAGMHNFGYEPAPVDLTAWESIIREVSTRFKDQLHGWEWLNEIVPGGKTSDPVGTYLAMCRSGTTAARAIDPTFEIQLAGGLWPRNFRNDLLNSGVGQYIDVLPVHYAGYGAIREAQHDLAVRQIEHVSVIDNETACGRSVWDMNPAQTLRHSIDQCQHVMTSWPDLLLAGASRIVYFGGEPNAAGNWTYLLDQHEPRPVAVTLAVVQNKLAFAKPLGKFFRERIEFCLFEKTDGSPLLFVRSLDKTPATFQMPGGSAFYITDYQGNVTQVRQGKVTVGAMPLIVENFDTAPLDPQDSSVLDIDQLKLFVSARIGSSPVPTPLPQHVADAAPLINVPVRLTNYYSEEKKFTLSPAAVPWGKGQQTVVSLRPDEARTVELQYICHNDSQPPPVSQLQVGLSVDASSVHELEYSLIVHDSAQQGNLIRNGDFEDTSHRWEGRGKVVTDPEIPANRILELAAAEDSWVSSWQQIEVPVPGQSYLYTAWIWSQGMDSGSNLNTINRDGSSQRFYMPDIFSTGSKGTGYWRFFAKEIATTEETRTLFLQPVGKGPVGTRTLYDNLMLTPYRGTDFVAFAGHDSPARGSEIPLLCENQLQAEKGYQWSPQSLAGRARFGWNDKALLLEVTVRDDRHLPQTAEADNASAILRGDALALAIFPRRATEGFASDQLRWYISAANPGGGSGTATLYRHDGYSLGGKTGHLAKDSSVYSLEIVRQGDQTIYRLGIPWEEIPFFAPSAGASFGCGLELIDSDNPDGPVGRMVWGGGLRDHPGGCGQVTLQAAQ